MATFADKKDSPERIIPRVTAIYVEIYSASEMTSLISIKINLCTRTHVVVFLLDPSYQALSS